jgi:signal transduction histidine kinase
MSPPDTLREWLRPREEGSIETDIEVSLPVTTAPIATRRDDDRILGTRKASLIFAGTVFLVTLVQVLTVPLVAVFDGEAVWPLQMPIPAGIGVLLLACAVQAATFLFSDRAPEAAVIGSTVTYLVVMFWLSVPAWLVGMKLVVALALFLLATRRPLAVSIAWFVGVVAVTVGGIYLWTQTLGIAPGIAVAYVASEGAGFAAPALGGLALGIWWGAHKRRATHARQQSELAEQEHEHRVEQARDRERARIAQELHDVAGQHLAGLIMLTDGALQLMATRPEAALELMQDVRNEGRFAAASLGGALTDLRAVGAEPTDVTEDLRRIDDLVAYWRKRGASIELRTNGDLDELPAVVSTSVYRCTQEALTNAAKHASGAPVSIAIAHEQGELSLTVENGTARDETPPVAGLGLGWGLTGIGERIELLRGTLRAGPRADGGWILQLHVPVPQTNESVP